jgi:hypothetical protein
MLVGFALLAAAMTLVPEPVTIRRQPRLTVRLGLEPALRPAFLAALPCLIATWPPGGLYLSLGPSIALQLEQSSNHLLGGAVITLLAGTGGLASLTVHGWPSRRAMLVGCGALAGGAVLTAAGIAEHATVAFYTGTVVAGAGLGAAFLGAFRTLAALATPARRGELVAAVYVAAYLAFSVPAVLAGLVSQHAGLRNTAVGYASAVAALALLALGATTRTTGNGPTRS